MSNGDIRSNIQYGKLIQLSNIQLDKNIDYKKTKNFNTPYIEKKLKFNRMSMSNDIKE